MAATGAGGPWLGLVWFAVCAVGGFVVARRLCWMLAERVVRHGGPGQWRLAMWSLIAVGAVAVALALRGLLAALS